MWNVSIVSFSFIDSYFLSNPCFIRLSPLVHSRCELHGCTPAGLTVVNPAYYGNGHAFTQSERMLYEDWRWGGASKITTQWAVLEMESDKRKKTAQILRDCLLPKDCSENETFSKKTTGSSNANRLCRLYYLISIKWIFYLKCTLLTKWMMIVYWRIIV